MSTPTLTIAIPTFNRPTELRRALLALIPQLGPDDELVLLDNASPVPAEVVLHGVIKELGNEIGIKARVVRNTCNIGGNANILRCIEAANCEYVWLLGDDDIPCPDAIQTIKTDLRYGALYYNYYAQSKNHPNRFEPQRCVGTIGMLMANECIGELLCISCSVFKVSAARAVYREAMLLLSTNGAQVLLAVYMLGESGVSYRLAKEIVYRPPPPPDQRFRLLPVVLTLGLLCDRLPNQFVFNEMQRLLRPRLRGWPSPLSISKELLEDLESGCDRKIVKYRAEQVDGRWLAPYAGWLPRIMWKLFRIVLIFSPLALFVLKFGRWIAKKPAPAAAERAGAENRI